MTHVQYECGLNIYIYSYLHILLRGSGAGLLLNDVGSVARACQNKLVLGDDGFWSDI